MILEVDNWYLGYSQILEDCRLNNGKKALILCHADVDAMAAARILTYMLRADQIEYELRACSTHTSLEKFTSTDINNDTYSYAAIVLLNVGGTRNLTRLFGNTDHKLSIQDTKIYVLDQRRPIHLANIHAEESVIVFWDPTHGDYDDVPSDGDNLSGHEDDSSSEDEEGDDDDSDDSDDEDSDDDDDNNKEHEMEFDDIIGESNKPSNKENDVGDDMDVDDDGDVDYDGEDEKDPADDNDNDDDDDDDRITPEKQKKKKQRRAGEEDDDDDDGNETDSTQDLEEDDPVTPPTATATTVATTPGGPHSSSSLPAMTPAQLHEQRQQKLKVYYSQGTRYGSPSSYLAYRIASQLRFGNLPDLLWLCMVGVTDAYLQSRLDILGYGQIAEGLSDACLKIFPTINALERAENTFYAEDLLVNNAFNANKTKLTFSERGRILPQTDFRFFLLRQSSLLDALQCSRYVSTQMQLWTPTGMQRLHELLARMGYPLAECKQPYSFLKPSLRRQLHSQLNQYKEEYNLDELEFTSFVRVTGFSSLTSASDVCYAASALLECPEIGSKNDSNNNADAQQQQDDWDMDCFHAAYDALGSHTAANSSSSTSTTSNLNMVNSNRGGRKAATSFQNGIQWASKLQRLILSTAVRLSTTNAITRLRHFRYAYITLTSSGGEGGGDSSAMMISSSIAEQKEASQEYHVLAKPLALTRLAHYLMDMHRANGKWSNRLMPLILLAEQPKTSTYLIAGFEMAAERGHLSSNKLGQNFSIVADMLKAAARLESFDAHVVEVASSHAQRFLENLHYLMDTA